MQHCLPIAALLITLPSSTAPSYTLSLYMSTPLQHSTQLHNFSLYASSPPPAHHPATYFLFICPGNFHSLSFSKLFHCPQIAEVRVHVAQEVSRIQNWTYAIDKRIVQLQMNKMDEELLQMKFTAGSTKVQMQVEQVSRYSYLGSFPMSAVFACPCHFIPTQPADSGL